MPPSMRASTAATNVPTAKLPAKNSWLRVPVPSASCVQRRANSTRVMAPATAPAIWSSCQNSVQGVGGALRLRDAMGVGGAECEPQHQNLLHEKRAGEPQKISPTIRERYAATSGFRVAAR